MFYIEYSVKSEAIEASAQITHVEDLKVAEVRMFPDSHETKSPLARAFLKVLPRRLKSKDVSKCKQGTNI